MLQLTKFIFGLKYQEILESYLDLTILIRIKWENPLLSASPEFFDGKLQSFDIKLSEDLKYVTNLVANAVLHRK